MKTSVSHKTNGPVTGSSSKHQPVVQPKLMVNEPGDRYEREADAMADRVMRMDGHLQNEDGVTTGLIGKSVQKKCTAGEERDQPKKDSTTNPNADDRLAVSQTSFSGDYIHRKCSKCEEEEERKKGVPIMRKEGVGGNFEVSDAFNNQLSATRGSGSPLPGTTRAFLEQAFNADFSKVRVHTDNRAASLNNEIKAKAFTYGSDIYFNTGNYDPDQEAGQSLIAHEMTHVLQQGASGPSIQRDSDRSLDERVASFKELVKSTAIQRLHSNRAALLQWQEVIDKVLSNYQLSVIALAQQGGLQPYMAMQDERNPKLQELDAMQAVGQARACTGCHLAVQASQYRAEHSFESQFWRSPNEIRTQNNMGSHLMPVSGQPQFNSQPFYDVNAYHPPANTTRGKLNAMLPDPRTVTKDYKDLRVIIDFLGKSGFRVLPDDFIYDLMDGDYDDVREEVHDNIDKRRSDYQELIEKIQNNDVDFKIFVPIITDLSQIYPDKEVIEAIQEELRPGVTDYLHAAITAVLMAVSLLLILFPPTSPAGVALLGASIATLAFDNLFIQGPKMIQMGQVAQLSTGANNVVSPETQDMGGFMVFMGSLAIVTSLFDFGSVIGQYFKTLQSARVLARMNAAEPAEVSQALATQGFTKLSNNTYSQGEFLITYLEDGRILLSHNSRPDLLIIVEDGWARMYQKAGPGEVEILIAEKNLGGAMNKPAADMAFAGAPGSSQASFPPNACYKQLTAGTAGEDELSSVIKDVFPDADQGVLWSVTPEGQAFPTSPVKDMNVYAPDGALPPGEILGTVKDPVQVLRGPLQPDYTPFDVFLGPNASSKALRFTRRSSGSPNLQGAKGEQFLELGAGGAKVSHNMSPLPTRNVDREFEVLGGKIGGESKNYATYLGKNPVPRTVQLDSRLLSELERDGILMRNSVNQPVWYFFNAPPSQALAQALDAEGIPYLVFSDRVP